MSLCDFQDFQSGIVFCHDHIKHVRDQDAFPPCPRTNCRFVHATAEEEREYKCSGYLPPHIRDQARNILILVLGCSSKM